MSWVGFQVMVESVCEWSKDRMIIVSMPLPIKKIEDMVSSILSFHCSYVTNIPQPWGGRSKYVNEDDGKPVDYDYTSKEITATAGNLSIQQH
jgi:hypothetical protein